MPTEPKPKLKSKYGGGAREGAGRPVSSATLKTQAIRKMMVDALHKRFKPVLNAQLDAAQGILIAKQKNGMPIYAEPGPDTQAFKTILEQVAGRATERVEVSGRDGRPLIVRLDT